MANIDWAEFKNYKKHSTREINNFEMLLEFLRSYYNVTNPSEMYEMMKYDGTAQMMLEKRDIKSDTDLEKHLYKHID